MCNFQSPGCDCKKSLNKVEIIESWVQEIDCPACLEYFEIWKTSAPVIAKWKVENGFERTVIVQYRDGGLHQHWGQSKSQDPPRVEEQERKEVLKQPIVKVPVMESEKKKLSFDNDVKTEEITSEKPDKMIEMGRSAVAL